MARHPHLWADRAAAGRGLAERLRQLGLPEGGAILVALPRGGVAVAAPIAAALDLPLVSWSVRKIGHPLQPEWAIGALAPGELVLWSREGLALSEAERRRLVAAERQELERRRRLFADPEAASLAGAHLVVVDDGIATGLTVRAALASLRGCAPASLSLAVPVLDRSLLAELRSRVDRLVVLQVVDGLGSVGAWYGSFEQLDDAEVLQMLEQGRQRRRCLGSCLSNSPAPRSGS
jgi:putative phosphoribosyl transferase